MGEPGTAGKSPPGGWSHAAWSEEKSGGAEFDCAATLALSAAMQAKALPAAIHCLDLNQDIVPSPYRARRILRQTQARPLACARIISCWRARSSPTGDSQIGI